MVNQIMLKFTQEEIEHDNLGLNSRIMNITYNSMFKSYIIIIEIREIGDDE